MAEPVSPEALALVAALRAAGQYPAAHAPVAEGQVFAAITLKQAQLRALLAPAARRAAGQVFAAGPAHVVWAQGESELALHLDEVDLQCSSGQLLMTLAVYCEQTGWAKVQVFFAVGSAGRPRGLFAATLREPAGPEPIVNLWSEALVAFAWQVLMEVLADVARATGKDERGNRLVPVEMSAERGSLTLVPMARHRFTGRTKVLTAKLRAKPVPTPEPDLTRKPRRTGTPRSGAAKG